MAAILCLCLGANCGHAQRASNWRVYKAADGLTESESTAITSSPQGRVWVKHGEAATISWLDGYDIYHLPSPGEGTHRIYESREGQLWSIYSAGITEFKEPQWVRHPIAEIERENKSTPLRLVQPIALLPNGPDRVLFLLPDRLMEFNAASNHLRTVHDVGQTELGRLIDLAPAPGGGVWISGKDGLGRLPGTVRGGVTASDWREFPLPRNLGLANLRNPIPDDEGGVTAVAERAGTGDRRLVHFDGQTWQTLTVLGGKVRQGWRQPDGSFWAVSINALSHLEAGGAEVLEKEAPVAGQFLDAAVEPKGVFWLATSEGLLRYAPLTWRSPAEAAPANALIHAILQDSSNRLWFASSTALMLYENGRWRNFEYPEKTELSFQSANPLYELPDHRLAIAAADHFLLFDPGQVKSNHFELVVYPEGRSLRLIGQLRDGNLCVQTFVPIANRPGSYLELFERDGFRPLPSAPANWSLESKLAFCYEAANHDLWLGGSAGVGFIRDQKFHTFGRADGEPPEAAACFLELSEGRFWCGGSGKISEFDGKSWSLVRAGFDRVNALLKAHDGTIWVASSDGLYHHVNGGWLHNGVEEGLPSATIYEVFQDAHGNVWAGTGRGLSQFYPTADIDPPRTSLSTATGQKEFYFDTPVTLLLSGQDKWKFTSPSRLLYSYRCDDAKWSPLSANTTVPFEQLVPGKHRCEARAMDRNGNVDDKHPAVMELTVILPWYLDRRLLLIFSGGLVASLFFAWIAIKSHLRLRRSFAEVERIVAQRTQELKEANQALLHSQKMQAMGTFAAGIAHDFNNILSIIKGSAQIIESHLEDKDKVRTRLDRIKTVVEQGAGIVRAILGYSRESSRGLAPGQVNQVVDETIKLLGDRFGHDLILRGQLAPNLPEVPFAKDMLHQMLVNLVLNAADALGGHGEVTVRTGVLEALPAVLVLAPAPAGRHVSIAVQDRGSGISAELQSRIFEPFFTTKALSTRRGTGLGLSMVYEFAKDQGFGVQLVSAVGQGSTFTILLPVKA